MWRGLATLSVNKAEAEAEAGDLFMPHIVDQITPFLDSTKGRKNKSCYVEVLLWALDIFLYTYEKLTKSKDNEGAESDKRNQTLTSIHQGKATWASYILLASSEHSTWWLHWPPSGSNGTTWMWIFQSNDREQEWDAQRISCSPLWKSYPARTISVFGE